MALMNVILFYPTTQISASRGHFRGAAGSVTLAAIPLDVSLGPRDLV